MPVFISYSHSDADFVDRLAAQLVLNKARVWIDRRELTVGDSILDTCHNGPLALSCSDQTAIGSPAGDHPGMKTL